MLNMIKMDLYRMLRTKSMYIIWMVMTAAVIFSTSMSRLDMKYINEEAQKQQTEGIQASEEQEQVNVGMSVSLPTQPGEKVTVADQIFANLQSKFVALFMVISVCLVMNLMAVIYGAADHLIHKIGAEKFQVLDYTVTGKITMLSMSPTNKECLTAVVIAAVFGIVVTILTGEVFRKRDI